MVHRFVDNAQILLETNDNIFQNALCILRERIPWFDKFFRNGTLFAIYQYCFVMAQFVG